ncbi:SDR family NAD(P)-dependent oxidoreductase [Dickeya dianthicola]|uniref:SDR family NAD(P)-dependent oxidoreductase n=1 Tax=Dickeya dianthicola TaxID=204039 RepID=UPI001F607E09|nr:SDR family NAD(P)-dependent oxidoreductase [Dickeya dianthicola]MCI4185726.1 SDR family NAD(P)-dependent oxidoreductase [Dickeya dianthicola]
MNNIADNQWDEEADSLLQSHHPHAINQWLVQLLYVQLDGLGVFSSSLNSLDFSTLADRLGLDPQFRSWWLESMAQLLEAGWVTRQGDALVRRQPLAEQPAAIWQAWDDYRDGYRHDHARMTQMNLVDTCLRNLPQILTGQVQATEVLFPNASMEKVEGIYKNNPVSDFFNRVLTKTVGDYVNEALRFDRNAQLHLVEIGAGTGGTTAMILPALMKYRHNIQEYLYTDLSQAFLMHARNHYGPDCPFLDYALWDIEQPLATQPIPLGCFDVAIATNVLHATKDIRATLRHCKAALRRGGMVVINELSDKSVFTHLTFGLLKGWWLHQDTALRIAGSPAIAPETWQEILEEEGFFAVEFPAQRAHALGQTIIVALSDGMIRQQRQPAVQSLTADQSHYSPLDAKQSPLDAKQRAISRSVERSSVAAATPEAPITEQQIAERVHDAVVSALAQTVNLSTAQIDAEAAFSEYGIDSILSVNFVNKINEVIGVRLNPAALYDYRSVTSLSGHIVRTAGHAVLVERAPETLSSGTETTSGRGEITQEYITACVITGLVNTVNMPPEQIDEQVAFSNFGIDSILSVNFVNQVNQALGINVNPALLYDYTTVETLSAHIALTCADRIGIPPAPSSSLPSSQPQPQPQPQSQWQPQPQPQPRLAPAPQPAAVSPPAALPASTPDPEPTPEKKQTEPAAIAVIGMAGQFPGAEDPQRFWENLIAQRSGIEELPGHYLDQARHFVDTNNVDTNKVDTNKEATAPSGKTNSKWGGIVKDRDCFDAKFFRITEQDALSMSPHQRLVLQESWKALEDAGYNPKALAGTNTSVFIGAEPSNYHQGSFVGSSEAIIASRVSYFLDMKGPALVVNTGCSSSAVAIHLACESLRRRETDLALAGGVFAALDAGALASLSSIGMLSHRAECPIFEQAADGMLLSEGIGIVALKRLDQAIADGDPIYGVIRASGINQDGASNGITAPSGTAQQQLLEQVYQSYHINPEEISYIEAHATGGRLGDTIEVNALARTFKALTDKQHYCALGSVKSHIGHTSAASGVIGLIKILLSMRHRQLPGLRHYQQINPLFELHDSAFYIQNTASEWKNHADKPRLAALNSFGHSGTNAHLVIEEYLPGRVHAAEPATAGWIIPLSAKTTSSLHAQIQALCAYLDDADRHDWQRRGPVDDALSFMQSMVYTLQVGREAMPERVFLIVKDRRDCLQQLQAVCRGNISTDHVFGHAPIAGRKPPALAADAYQHRRLHQLSRSELEAIGQAWLQGTPVDWQSFYQQPPTRIHLPGYVFAKDVFRAPVPASEASMAEKSAGDGDLIKEGSYPIGRAGLFTENHPWSQPFNHHHRILHNHQAFGQSLLPGLAYIDLLFQFFHRQGMDYRQLEMRNLTIHYPFTIGDDYGVDAQISCQKSTQGYWHLNVEGREVSDGSPQSELKRYMSAEMHPVPASIFHETLDVAGLQKTAPRQMKLQDAYAEFGGDDIRHRGPMVGDGVIYQLPSANLIDIAVPDESLFGAEHYLFHPVLIDGSAIGSGDLFLAQNKAQDIFLPLYYESFRASEPLSGRCITRVSRASLKQTEQLSYLTMEFFKPSGEKIGELKNFTCKRVRDPAAINASRTRAAQVTESVVMPVKPAEPMKKGIPVASETSSILSDEHDSARERAEHILKKILADTLAKSTQEIESDVGYYELGLDSAGLLQMVQSLEQSLKVKLNPTLLFEYATVGTLAEYLLERYPESFRSFAGMAPDVATVTERDNAHQASGTLPDSGISAGINQADAEPINARQAASHLSPILPTSPILPNAPESEDIAVIGMSGRYPGAKQMAEFWENLKAGKDCVTEIPGSRWQKSVLDGITSPSGRPIPQWGGFIEDVDCFDAQFFRVSPREAQWLDPQERLFLETCWAAIEDAGYTPETLVAEQGPNKRRDVGVFVGVMHNDYALIASEIVNRGQVVPLSMNYAPIANRVSYFCGFHGPSFAVDTVCSSSLTALHLALESVRSGESKVALAGGVNLSLHPYKYMTYGLADMYSTDGRCRTFGDGGNGFVSGEGVGAVLLKPLSQAVKDRDNIYAVIKGSTINHVGQVSGITVPSPVAQADLMLRCYEKTGIDPRTISYIEAHGTGTSLGDPIEVQGLVKAFRQHTKDKQFCAIGSVKSNIGHAESAAGISGLSKVILQLHHKTLVPSLLHSEQVNPYLELDNSPFYIQRETQYWEQPTVGEDGEKITVPRRAGISSFGATGSNAHVIVEEYLPPDVRTVGNRQQQDVPLSAKSAPLSAIIVPLSAKDEERLQVMARNLAQFLEVHPDIDSIHPADLAFTLQVGRRALEERVVFVVQDLRELQKKLVAFAEDDVLPERCWRGYGIGGSGKESGRDTGFMSAEDSTALLQRWVEQNAVHKIARFWTEGFHVDWYQLYSIATPCRISLPGYPFARERHWIEAPNDLGRIGQGASSGEASTQESALQEERETLMLFTESWQQMPHPATSRQDHRFETLICFLSEPESQRLLQSQMKVLAPQTAVVFVSRLALEQGVSGFHLPRTTTAQENTESYQHCFAQLKSARIPPEHSAILYLWPLEERGQIQDFAALHDLLSSMVAASMAPARLLLAGVSHHSLERAYLESWIGIERSLTSVLPNTQCAVAVSVAPGSGLVGEKPVFTTQTVFTKPYISMLYQELTGQDFESICYEGTVRYVLKVQPSPLALTEPAVAETGIAEAGIKQGGTYLITGGFGGLGLIFARYLAQHYSARLILTGRSAMNADRKAIADELTQLGGQVHYIQADVCDVGAMRFSLVQARQLMGPILGVIHTAGLEASEPVFEKSRQAFTDILRPKVEGTQLLDELLAQDPLDFVCYFSSSAALLGDFGSCDYAIGNRFQMGYGKHRMAQVQQGNLRGKTLIINWPFWKEGKMGAKDRDSAEFYLRSSGQRALESEEGLLVFEQLLRQSEGQHLVMAGKPSRVARFLGLGEQPVAGRTEHHPASGRGDAGNKTMPGNQDTPPDSAQKYRQVTTPGSGDAPDMRTDVSHVLKTQISRLLGTPVDRVGLNSNFADFGFDSITLASFSRELSQYFDVEITPAVLFGHSSVKRLTEYFCREHAQALQTLFSRQASPETDTVSMSPLADGDHLTAGREEVNPTSGYESGPVRTTTVNHQPVPAATNTVASGVMDEPIAVIGMSGRFPQADTIDEFWETLIQGESCIGEMSGPRWDWQSVGNNRPSGSSDHRDKHETLPQWGAFMTDIMQFDAAFFDITPKEAMEMDPRQRIFLQEAWHTFEDAGYMGQRIRGMSCGVYVGAEESDYGAIVGDQGSINGNQNATLAARISYALDLKGPNMALTAACASGLVAVHQACLALRQGDCEMALAGGINLLMTPWVYQSMNRTGMLSPDGNASVFDQRANGLVPGEAVAVVLLKPLSKAKADGDRIYGCIKASGVNYDGKTNGITAPNPVRQAELLKNVYDRYRINPGNIQYVISHSTGSQLGDPIEVQALTDAFAGRYSDSHRCVLGSIKPIIGHTFAASGVVSLVAMLKAMAQQTIPATHRFDTCNRYIKLERTPFTIHPQNQPWLRRGTQPRLGAISATGISGTNAHAVIEEYLADDPDVLKGAETHAPEGGVLRPSGIAARPSVVPISAKTTAALQAYAQALVQFLQRHPATRLDQLAYSLQTGRDAMAKRVAFVVSDVTALREKLALFIGGDIAPGAYYHGEPRSDEVTGWAREQEWDDGNSPAQLAQIQGWIAAGQWQELAGAWVSGVNVDWRDLYREAFLLQSTAPQSTVPQRISLPVYPFQGKRYWANLPPAELTAQTQTTSRSTAMGETTAVMPGDAAMNKRSTSPLDAVTRQVRALLMQTLYFEESEIENHQLFTELGLNSINAVGFIEAVNQAFACGLTIKAIFDYPSIDALSLHLGNPMPPSPRDRQGNAVAAASVIAHDAVNKKIAGLQSQPPGKAWLRQYPECIPLSKSLRDRHINEESAPEGSRFWIHPLTGSTGLYLKIAENLADDYAIWGIQSRGFLTRFPPLDSIESMARYYIDIIQASNAAGPYELAGYSMGGIIAYEMARQLQLAGLRVSSLILLEPPFPQPDNHHESSPFYYRDALLMSANFFLHYSMGDVLASGQIAFETIAYTEQELMRVDADKQVTWLAEGCLKKGVKQPLSVVKDKIENMAQILKHNRDAMAAYSVKALPNAQDIDLHYMTITPSYGDRPGRHGTLSALAENNRHVLGEELTHDESHCQRWLHYLPGAQVFRTNARDHFHLLSERESVDMISERCRDIYRGNSAGKTTPNASGKRAATPRREGRDPIAIIGMSGQFPGAKNPDDFWHLLEQGQSAFTPPPDSRGWSVSPENGGEYAGYGGFLSDVEHFDPLFFQISPHEASMLDPCERLFLQESWKAIEDAGMIPETLSGKRCGVFCGSGGDYSLRFAQGEHFAPNITLSQVPGRVSYSLNLKGPCLTVEAGCASSLLAVAQACDHLVSGQCEVAIAGGALIYSTPNMLLSSSRLGLLSAADRGCAFSAQATGMMPGESVGVVILKPLQQALADGDRIHGVIEAWGSNHNGKTNGIMAPSASAQEALLSDIYQRFDIHPERITLVEAHAAGMPAADAAEVDALTNVFRQSGGVGQSGGQPFCALGSVENNIGHAFHSAGMNHLFKVLVALRHRAIPGTPNTQDQTALLPLEHSPFYINSKTVPWKVDSGQARRAAISSLGATGINVHLVVAELRENEEGRAWSAENISPNPSSLQRESHGGKQPVCIVLSGKSASALQQRCRDLQDFVQAQHGLNLKQLSANLLLRRSHFSHRCACVVSDAKALLDFLDRVITGAALTQGDNGYQGKVSSGRQALTGNAASPAVAHVRQAVHAPTDSDNLLALARLYVNGVDFFSPDFNAEIRMEQAYSPAEKFPLSLPGYPFDKRLCWAGAVQAAPAGTLRPEATDLQTTQQAASQQAASQQTASQQAASQQITQQLTGMLAELAGLSVAEIDLDEPVTSYGIDSLLGLRLLNRINSAFVTEFDAHLLTKASLRLIAGEIAHRPRHAAHDSSFSEDYPFATAPEHVALDDLSENRPAFIQSVLLALPVAAAPVEDMTSGRAELSLLLEHGIGVWKDAAGLRFEFYRNALRAGDVLDCVKRPDCLWSCLAAGVRYYPVSHIQAFILHESEVKKRSTFNIGQGFWIDMPADLSLLNQALNDMVRHHAILRTGAEFVGPQWAQVVHDALILECREVCWPYISDKETFEQTFAGFQKSVNATLFQADRMPMFELYLAHNGADLGAVYFVTHHFHADGFTLFMFLQELGHRYDALRNGTDFYCPKPPAEYAHFALSQFGEHQEIATRYWLSQLHDKRASFTLRDKHIALSSSLDKQHGKPEKAGAYSLDISDEMLNRLQSSNRRQNTTLTQLVTCALATLLYRITGENMPIQMAYNLRDRYEFESVYGDFSSSVPLVLTLQPHFSLRQVWRIYDDALLQVQKYKHFDFVALHQQLAPEGLDAHDHTLLGSLAVDSNDRDTLVEVTAFAQRLLPMSLEEREPVAPLLMGLLKTHGKLSLPFIYDRRYFSPDVIPLLADHLLVLLDMMVEQPELKVEDIPVPERLAERLSPEGIAALAVLDV